MLSRAISHLRGNVVGYLALFIAISGTSYAAISLPKNSVGTKQIRSGAVTSQKIKAGTLEASNFKSGALPSGPQGPKGDTGPQGPKGDTGLQGPAGATNVVVRSTTATVPAGTSSTVTAACATGERAVGGGYDASAGGTFGIISRPANLDGSAVSNGGTPTAWAARYTATAYSDSTGTVYVTCAAP